MKKQMKSNEVKLQEMISALTEQPSYSLREITQKEGVQKFKMDICDVILPGINPWLIEQKK